MCSFEYLGLKPVLIDFPMLDIPTSTAKQDILHPNLAASCRVSFFEDSGPVPDIQNLQDNL